jgi:hypothetical protein
MACSECGAKRGHLGGCTGGGGGGRRSPRSCKKTGGQADDGHTHYCLENEGHGGSHVCGVPGNGRRNCGFRW